MTDAFVISSPCFYIKCSIGTAVVIVGLCVCFLFSRLCHLTGCLQTQRSKRRADLRPPRTPAAVPLPVPMATGGYAPEKDVLINLHQVRFFSFFLSCIIVLLAPVKKSFKIDLFYCGQSMCMSYAMMFSSSSVVWLMQVILKRFLCNNSIFRQRLRLIHAYIVK